MSNASIRRVRRPGLVVAVAMISCAPAAALAQTAPPARAVAAKPAAPAPQITQGAVRSKSGGSEEIVARVGSTNISADEVRSYVATLGQRDRAAVSRDPALL